MDYQLLKHIHVSAVVLSGAFFLLRYFWMLLSPRLLEQRWVRILPHCIDTVLLLSAIGLAVTLQQYPVSHAWLSAKVLALLAYIVLGSVALKRGKTRRTRALAGIAALLSFAYIVATAFSHRVLLPF